MSQTPEDLLIETIEEVDKMREQIHAKERDCLERIFCRFCLKNAILADISKVTLRDFEDRPNYWEYWWKLGMKDQYLLMSRELIVEGGVPKLNIIFNKELAKDDEL